MYRFIVNMWEISVFEDENRRTYEEVYIACVIAIAHTLKGPYAHKVVLVKLVRCY